MVETKSFFGGKITMTIYHTEEEKETVKGFTVGELLEKLNEIVACEEDEKKVVFIKSGNGWKTIKDVYLDPDDGQVLITLK